MAETADAQVQISAEQQQQNAELSTITISPFAKDAWTENIAEKKESPATVTPEKKVDEPKKDEEEVFELKDWLKKEFDIEDPAILKAEREELKTLKSTPKEEIKFADDQSKHLHELIREGKRKEVRQFLETQEQLESLSSLEVNNDNAEDIIKLQMKLKNPTLTSKEIDFEYKQNYVAPREPVQKATETDEEFEERQSEWKEQKSAAEMKRIIAAKMAQPELNKLKSEIVLPEISKPQEQKVNEPDLEALKVIRENFLNKLESDYSKVNGFSTQVKDESVDIPVSFKIPDEIKVAIKGRLQKDFDVDNFILSRWFGEKGEPKIEQLISDIYLLENPDKVLSGIANNAANLRLEEFKKQIKNIDLNGKTNQNTFQPNQDGKSNISPFKKEAWSESPPIHNS